MNELKLTQKPLIVSNPTPNPLTKEEEALWVNPYKKVTDDFRTRLNVDVHCDDALTIKAISPFYGTIQTIVGLFINSLVNELKSKGIEYFSPANHNEFVRIVLRRTALATSRDGREGDELRPASGVHQDIVNAANQSAESPGQDGERLRSGNNNKRKGSKKG